jgi:hypothetical protein
MTNGHRTSAPLESAEAGLPGAPAGAEAELRRAGIDPDRLSIQLVELLEEDHTLGRLDTVIMTSIFVLLILLLITYGAHPPAASGERFQHRF